MSIKKDKRNKLVACLAALLFTGTMAGTALADTIGDCSLTGYTFMGGNSAYVSTPAGPNAKNYFLSQPLNYDFSGTNMWGYGWTGFSTGTETVDSAYLVFDVIGIGAMSSSPASEESPAMLDLYSLPDTVDITALGSDASLRASVRDTLDAQSPLFNTLIMTSNGTYCVDITDIYNAAVASATGADFVFSSPDDNYGAKFAGFGNSEGGELYISSTVVGTLVPEPATMTLMACGLGLLGFRHRRT